MSDVAAPSRSSFGQVVKIVAGLVVLAALFAVGRNAGGRVQEFAAWVDSLGSIGPLVFIGGYAVAVVAFVPAVLLTLAAGAIFGIRAGVVYVFCAAVLGASMAFLLSRYVARDAVERRIAGNASFAAIDQAIATQGRWIVFLLRLSPAFPFGLLNYALGLTRVRFVDFVVASVGMIPGTFLYVYYGSVIGDVAKLAGGAAVEKGTGYYAVLALGLVATIAVTAFVTRIARRALAEATSKRTGQASILSARGALERATSSGALSPAASDPATWKPRADSAGPSPAAPDAETPRLHSETAALEQILGSRPASEALALHRHAEPGDAASDATARSDAPPDSFHSPVTPVDEHNSKLLDNVRPVGWTNPKAASRYDLVVIGAGTGGLICAAVGSGLGAKVALIERNLMGGDCLNYGCVPSKALIRHARRVAEASELIGSSGRSEQVLDHEFAAAMERMRRIRADISHDDSARRYRDELGVDVFQGNARFAGTSSIEVAGQTLRFKRAVIATGARATVLPINGLAEAGYLTNETVFNLVERPKRLVVIGGGPIGCELAQAMRRLGCSVTILTNEDHLLGREDADAAAIIERRFEREGIRVLLGTEATSVSTSVGGKIVAYRSRRGDNETACDEILLAVGRTPNVEHMGLEAAGVSVTDKGIVVDDNLRTTNRRVFAVGDCCMRWQFTHAADAAAKIAVQNALFFGRKKLSALTMPWCTFTDPEVAHVGLYEHDARQSGVEIDTFTVPLEKVNRAVTDGETDGFVRVHAKKGGDRILGATIVAAHAGEMISEVSLAMAGGLGLAKVASVIHPYPTQAEGIKAAANAYMRTKLTPGAKKFLGFLIRLNR
jgi:pyruvate/2-oxoglutarate dehydrogenase complex dihydrolipoamide dehydrogenase (E3) component/uncharacterized membrane protein YdjX (TVP38/TMEM64 family)